jgi:DNA-binding response OmpR family regulator
VNGFQRNLCSERKGGGREICRGEPGLIMMNSIMPEMDSGKQSGYCGQIRRRTTFRFCARRQCSSPHLRAWIEVGCNDYIVKLFTSDELLRKIAALIPGSVSSRALFLSVPDSYSGFHWTTTCILIRNLIHQHFCLA